MPPPAKSRQSDRERGAPSHRQQSRVTRVGDISGRTGRTRRRTDGGRGRPPPYPPRRFLQFPTEFRSLSPSDFLLPSPPWMLDAALDITSPLLKTLLLKCQILGHHIGEIANINPPKYIILGLWFLSIVIFPVQKHFSKGRRCIHLSRRALFCEIMERDCTFASTSPPCRLSQFARDRRGSVALPH